MNSYLLKLQLEIQNKMSQYLTSKQSQEVSKYQLYLIYQLMFKIIVVCLLALLVTARDDPSYDQIFGNKQLTSQAFTQEQYWFDQITDHYDYHTTSHWKQRYWVNNEAFKPKSGPVFLYICGQWVCQGVPQTRLWSGMLAQKLNGIVIALQHRFYGASLPFGKDSFTLENMKLLNSEQALRDIANFIQTVKANNLYGITDEPWVIVGGSYAGALVAWFRYKYPHLVIASIASSAVINAIENFEQFDEQIYQSSHKSGDYCSQALRDVSQRVEQILESGEQAALKFKSQFLGGEHLNNKEFLFYWADSIVMPIQYGTRVQFCEGLKGKSADQQLDYLIQNAQKLNVYEYSSFYLRNETFTYQTQSNSRPWYYQYCTEYGWFQTFSSKNPIRSKQLTLDFYREFCAATYGEGTWAKVSRKNNEYGGLKLASSRIFFANGGQDPWRWASLQENRQRQLIARVVDCDNTAHCADLHTPTDSDCQSLIDARNEEYTYLKKWIAEYWRENEKKRFENMLLKKLRQQ